MQNDASAAAATRPRNGPETPTAGGGTCSYVMLSLGEQLCGVPVLAVRDVLAGQPIARIPLAPPEVAGNLNLRGRIVTAIDLRARVRLPPLGAGLKPMSVVTEQGSELYALLVDQVSEVVSLNADDMEANPPTLSPIWSEYSRGVYRVRDRLLVVLDVDKLLQISPALAA